ncbi:MAG: carbohydrate ABC transporter permease [Proteobacteria bacterium]|nr:carbohydrate ABC transporter permease [Pseudomonadota bacterium]
MTARNRRRGPSRLENFLVYAALAAALAFALLPLLWGLSTSLKAQIDVHKMPPVWIPSPPTFANYADAVFDVRFGRYLVNTLIVVFASLVLSTGLALHAAWATVRFRFAGREGILLVMWATIMVPGIAVIVPLYMASVDLGLYDTLASLVIVYSAWLVPTLVWLLRGFIAAIPYELEEAARIDGCSRIGAFWRVTMPLLRPGLLAAGVLVFVMVWNEFLIGYSLTLSDGNRMIQVGIYYFMTETGVEYGPLTAAAIASIAPIAVLYALLQRAFIQGLTGGAVKG